MSLLSKNHNMPYVANFLTLFIVFQSSPYEIAALSLLESPIHSNLDPLKDRHPIKLLIDSIKVSKKVVISGLPRSNAS